MTWMQAKQLLLLIISRGAGLEVLSEVNVSWIESRHEARKKSLEEFPHFPDALWATTGGAALYDQLSEDSALTCNKEQTSPM